MPEWVVPKAPKVWNMQKKTAEWKKCVVQKKNEQDGEKIRSSTNEINGKASCVQKTNIKSTNESTVDDFIQAHE